MAFFELAGNRDRIPTYFYDKITGFNIAYIYCTKDQTTNIIIDCAALIKRQFGKELKLFKRDNVTRVPAVRCQRPL